MRKTIFCAAALAITVTLSTCASLLNVTGRTIEGKTIGVKVLERWRGEGEAAPLTLKRVREKGRGESLIITHKDFPGLEICATAHTAVHAEADAASTDGGGGFEYFSLNFLSTSLNGWNEFSLELLGSGTLTIEGKEALLTSPEPPELGSLSSGLIRLKSTRLSGGEALSRLKNRRERLLALIDWMKEQSPPPLASRDAFAAYWKPILLPELSPLDTHPVTYGWLNADWVEEDGVYWDRRYTGFIFPEELRPLRDTGALLRDWEEALPWLYLEYQWDSLAALLEAARFCRR